jgi:pilus assembly protein CpaB
VVAHESGEKVRVSALQSRVVAGAIHPKFAFEETGMNRTRLLFIGSIALALGAFVSFLVYSKLKNSSAADNRPGVDVVVAADDLDPGAKIQDHDVKIVRFPEGSLPANTFRHMSQVIGRGVVLPMSSGEFILPSKLAGEHGGSGLPSLIPTGMLAVTVRVNDVTSVAGFVVAGTHVDVLLTGNPAGGGEQQQTTTVLENVAVVATGTTLERNSTGEPQTSPDVTLLVSPDDAQKLALATTQGKIQLALRNPLDTSQHDLNATGTNALYKGVVTAAPAPKPQKIRHAAVPAAAVTPAYSVEVIQGITRKEQPLDDSH